MQKQCIFYLTGQTQLCDIMKALQIEPVSREAAEHLSESWCATDAFTDCPIYRQVVQHLAAKNRSLSEILGRLFIDQ